MCNQQDNSTNRHEPWIPLDILSEQKQERYNKVTDKRSPPEDLPTMSKTLGEKHCLFGEIAVPDDEIL